MILHELYFAGLGDESQPGAALADALGRDFGSIDRWRAPNSLRRARPRAGVGLGFADLESRRQAANQCLAADHATTLAGGQPIVALDVYEQAYQMD